MILAEYRPTLNEVAKLVGKSSRWIANLRAEGELPGDGATLTEWVQAWTSYQVGAGKPKEKEVNEARILRAQADIAEAKAQEMRKQLLRRHEVSSAVQSAFARVRAKLLSLPAKCAPLVHAKPTIAAVQDKLTELVHEALLELASTKIATADPDHHVDGGGERGDGGHGGDLVAGPDAAAETDGQPVGGHKPATQRRSKRRAG
ncbi:hypothetical protein M2336_002800 [Sphingobium sp. B1D7B]|uniref:hypothetical protein n=1 Tax=Sphingobium sp. B1D7B TaxID=2940578 RepID=UPI0022244325|nr:hypothetical protein [Sphingobium sp. B1D7B]MCW2406171.1 hypothetical protein [Sphingobium sp. B1D7B]